MADPRREIHNRYALLGEGSILINEFHSCFYSRPVAENGSRQRMNRSMRPILEEQMKY